MKMRKGFTLVELLVVIAIIGLLIGILFPVLSRAQEAGKRAVCSNNLKGIGQALHVYNSGAGTFPKFDFQSVKSLAAPVNSANAVVTDKYCRGFADMETNSTYAVQGGKYYYYTSVTAPLWMLVKDGANQPKQYQCPSAGKEYDPMTIDGNALSTVIQTGNTWNFYRQTQISYSPLNIYNNTMGAKRWGDPTPDFVIMGDENNGDSQSSSSTVNVASIYKANTTTPASKETLRKYQSQNHRGEGQNLLFGDTHVAFVTDPYQGPGGDNVYAVNLTLNTSNELPAYDDTAANTTNNPLLESSTTNNTNDVCLIRLQQ